MWNKHGETRSYTTKSRKNGLKLVTGNTMICAWKRYYPLSTSLQKWENTGNLPTGVCKRSISFCQVSVTKHARNFVAQIIYGQYSIPKPLSLIPMPWPASDL